MRDTKGIIDQRARYASAGRQAPLFVNQVGKIDLSAGGQTVFNACNKI